MLIQVEKPLASGKWMYQNLSMGVLLNGSRKLEDHKVAEDPEGLKGSKFLQNQN